MTFGEQTTIDGYNCGECASALQKSIRRGHEADALFFATELDRSNFGEYVWKRLKIICSEDVGLAEPHLAATIFALYQNWLDQRKKKDARHAPERLFLVHAVILLARARKSRMVDNALVAMYEALRPRVTVPDYALDRHTTRGRMLRRGWWHFWDQGAHIENKNKLLDDPYEQIARKTRSDAKTNALKSP